MVERPAPPWNRQLPGSPPRSELTAADVIAGGVCLAWLLFCAIYVLTRPPAEAELETLTFVVTLIAVFMPVAMIWVGLLAARASRIMRDESRRLQAAVDGLRTTYLADRQGQPQGQGPSVIEQKLAEIARAAKASESALAMFASTRQPAAAPAPAPGPVDQPSLALGPTAARTMPVERDDLIRALNFPDTEDDEAGFAALRRALADRTAKSLIQAAQDVLTLLSQDGIYMDDLDPDRARPEVWRRFARGERGKSVASLGGVRDRASLALATGRMREDTIFRDSAHHFLRLFDRMLLALEPVITDEELVDLSETRTARAFMLLGRVAGTFD